LCGPRGRGRRVFVRAGGATVPPRLIVPLFQYLPTDPASTSQFELFRSVLSTKLSALADEASAALSPSGAPQAEFPGRLELYLRKGRPLEDTLEDPAQRRLYWDKSNSLELLRGRVWLGTSGKPHVVQSDIYIGDLRGAFPRSDVVVKLAIDPDEVSTTNDSHSVVTYFALAMEARRLGCDQAISRNLLARAKSILQDIRRRAGALPGDLAVLEKVIEEDLGK
jgi:hypothetical protein